jgi:hypothetical protein
VFLTPGLHIIYPMGHLSNEKKRLTTHKTGFDVIGMAIRAALFERGS